MMSLSSVMLFLGLSLLVCGTNGKVVPFIDACPINDDACVFASAQKVIPHIIHGNEQLKIKSFDPLNFPAIDGSIDSFLLEFQNLVVTGASKCKLLAVKRPEELKIFVEVQCPISAHGQYKCKGNVLQFDVYGNGPFKFVTENIKITVNAALIVVDGKDGKQHYKINKFDFTYDPIGDVNIELKNLYDGDEEKAKPMNDFIASEGKTLLKLIGNNVIKEVITSVVHVIGDIINKVPLEEINAWLF